MSDTIDDKTWDAEAQDRLRDEVKEALGKEPMTVAAQEGGIAYATLAAWMSGKYQGNNERVAEQAAKWLAARRAKQQVRATIRRAPDFVETTTARRIFSALEHAQHAVDLVVIAGGPGTGKTTTLERYKAQNPNVWVLTGEPCFSTPRMLLDCLAQELGLTERYSSQTVSRAIQRRIKGTGGLLIIDECQHLSIPSLDQMRTLHDLAKVGVALVGNETVQTRFEGSVREAKFAQLYSRVGMRISRSKPLTADITALIDAWGVGDAEQRKLLQMIAQKPGALRSMTKVLQLAHHLADSGSLTADLIQRAYEMISSSRLLVEAA